ncbi:MAG: tetratricopeptide repeat protein [Flavobacteriales bacterium]|nr:tetratricopeptide repeat protein [Flavobacteriales bacterium]
MHFKKIILFAILFLFGFYPILIFSQNNNDAELAMQHMQEGEYEKASFYLEKLYNKSGIEYYYDNLLVCYIKLGEFKKAEKLAEKQLNRFPTRLQYLVDLGSVYEEAGNKTKATQQYEKSIKELSIDQKQITELANAFARKKLFEYAINTYLKGRKLLKGFYPFNMELASVYKANGNFDLMIGEYLDLLLIHDSYIQSVQNALQNELAPDPDLKKTELLKSELLKRIQKNSDKTIFSELLIWFYVQEKNHTAALLQAKALDKKLNEDGYRIMELGMLALSDKNYDAATECYEYIIKKGRNSFNYLNARMELVNVLHLKITTSGAYTPNDLILLETNYIAAINDLGKSHSTIPLLLGYAQLQAFYLYKYKEAIQTINEILLLPQLKGHDKAKAKILLADVNLLTGEIWEASLLYSQVEKEFKYDIWGEDAKFKNAKISYYTGNFKWAKAQLDVLKGSTSKLIANDALELSLLITDNTTLDTNTLPLFVFAQTDLLIYQNKFDEALLKYDTLLTAFPSHSLNDEIIYRKAQIMLKKKEFQKAAFYYSEILKDYSYDIWSDNALFYLAELYEKHLNDKEKAMNYYKQLFTNYTGSIFVIEARKRFRTLRGDSASDDFDKLLEK